MVIGNLPNYEYYSGYEGEPEVVLNLCGKEGMSLHIWTGYFDDIFENAMLNGEGWTGFTRDIQQCERTFAGDGNLICIDIDEYLTGLQLYGDCNFEFEESAACLELICDFLAEAKKMNYTVQVSVS